MFNEIKNKLLTIYDKSEAHSLALIVMEEIGKVPMAKDLTYNYPSTKEVDQVVARLLNNEPIQYIIGWSNFCGIKIKCDKRALIPRPETEWMVQQIIDNHSSNIKKVLDLGTGTGCIAIAIAKRIPDAMVTGVDISREALELARENAIDANVENLQLTQGNITNLNIEGTFDLIISNPPYITQSEKKNMKSNVLDWEPSSALFVPDEDPLEFHRAIASYATSHLTNNGLLVMEINESLAKETLKLIKGSRIVDDQYGKPRFIMKRNEQIFK